MSLTSSISSDLLFATEGGLAILASNIDSVGIFDENFNQLFQNARPMRVDVTPRARLMDHPLETGQITTDYKVILPTEIRMPVVISAQYYRDTYQQIYSAWVTSQILTVQTHVGNYTNMVIAEPPHEEVPDRYDVVTVNLMFRQIPLVGVASNFSPADPTQSDTTVLGFQIPSIYTIAATAGAALKIISLLR